MAQSTWRTVVSKCLADLTDNELLFKVNDYDTVYSEKQISFDRLLDN